jgi:glycosyltransferase involved in cell wall biosynthesis
MISILLATYNGEKYIKKSIESILNQTFTDFELLIGLNGVTDNTEAILRSYEDDRIRIFNYGDERGKAKTLNKLLMEARYDWIAIQDDDDIWIDKKLEKQISLINQYDVIGTWIKYIDNNENFIGSPRLRIESDNIKFFTLNGNNQIANTSVIFKKNISIEVNGWREDIDGVEDFDFWIKLLKKDKKFINIPEYLVLHRIHSESNFNTKKHDIRKIL